MKKKHYFSSKSYRSSMGWRCTRRKPTFCSRPAKWASAPVTVPVNTAGHKSISDGGRCEQSLLRRSGSGRPRTDQPPVVLPSAVMEFRPSP